MKRVLTILFLLFSVVSFCQKIKVKKEIVYVDDIETYKIVNEGGNIQTLSTLSGNEFISLLSGGYDEYIKGVRYFNKVYTIKFLNNGQEIMVEKMYEKDVLKAIYKSGMVESDGKINEEKMNVFVNKYHNSTLKYKLAN